MSPEHDLQTSSLAPTRRGLAGLISTALVLSLGISIAAAAMLLVAGMWLERHNAL